MFKLGGWNRKIFTAFVIGAAAISIYGVSNVVNAFHDNLQSSIVNTASTDTLPAKGYDPGSPLCNPAGCGACRGCAGLEYSQTVDENTASAVQVSLIE
jgi:hypothetical protein